MDTKDKLNENQAPDPRESIEINELRADEKRQANKTTRKNNRLWLWFAIIVLLFILFWWLFSIGAFEAMS